MHAPGDHHAKACVVVAPEKAVLESVDLQLVQHIFQVGLQQLERARHLQGESVKLVEFIRQGRAAGLYGTDEAKGEERRVWWGSKLVQHLSGWASNSL